MAEIDELLIPGGMVPINMATTGKLVSEVIRLRAENERLRALLLDVLDRSDAIAQWHQGWDLPFEEEDEWSGDAKLWRDARFRARGVFTSGNGAP